MTGVAAALAAAAAYFIIWRTNNGKEKPPRKAPQLHIQNPGEQSEFPSSPEESQMER